MSTAPVRTGRASARQRLAGLVLAIIGLLAASSAAGATAAPGSPAKRGVAPATFGIGPANARGIDGRPLLNYVSSPGGQTKDHIAVLNLATRPLVVRLYTADGVSGVDGNIGYEPLAHAGTDARTWIELPPGTSILTLKPRSSTVLPITLHVPSGATPGDHIAGIVVSVTSKVRNKSGENVNFEQRVALRTLIRVSGPIKAGLQIDHLVADYHGTLNPFGSGSVHIGFRVRNNGNINLGGKQAITVTGLFGSTGALTAIANVPVLIPGGTYPVTLTVHHVWPEIFMHARVTVHPAGLATAANPVINPVSQQTSFRAIPWTLSGLLALVLVGVAVAIIQRRRRRARPTPPGPEASQPPPAVLATKG